LCSINGKHNRLMMVVFTGRHIMGAQLFPSLFPYGENGALADEPSQMLWLNESDSEIAMERRKLWLLTLSKSEWKRLRFDRVGRKSSMPSNNSLKQYRK